MAMARDPRSKPMEPGSMVMALLGLVHTSSFVFSVFSPGPGAMSAIQRSGVQFGF